MIFMVTLCFAIFRMYAQGYEKMVVSTMNHYIIHNDYYNVDPESFPCYFNDSSFLNDIRDTILLYVKKHFGIDQVEFNNHPMISCAELSFSPKIKTVIPYNPEENTLYLNITTSISFRRIEYYEAFYQLSATINIVTSKNKKIAKSSSTIPFMIRPSDGILTDTLMHRMDFEIFYLDALSAAFNKSPELFEKRFIYQPLAEQYDDILSASARYSIERIDTIFALGKEDGEIIPILDVKNLSSIHEEPAPVDDKYQARKRYKITHLGNNGQNTITLTLNNSLLVDVDFSGGMISGDLSYQKNGVMTGSLSKDSVYLFWNVSSSVAEIWINKKLLSIVHYQSGYEDLYLRYDLAPVYLQKVVFLVFLYDEAENIIQENYYSSSPYYLQEGASLYLYY